MFYGLIAALVIVIVVLTVGFYLERKRRQAITAVFASLGGESHVTMIPQLQETAVSAVPGVSLRTGGAGVKWFGRARVDGHDLTMYEHSYTTGTGKSRSTHYHTVVGVAAPKHWPGLRLAAEHLGHKIAGWFGKSDFQVEDPEFNARWRVTTDDENFALVFLAPEMQDACMRLPKGWEVMAGFGSLAIVRAGRIKPAEIPAALALPAGLLTCVPQELLA